MVVSVIIAPYSENMDSRLDTFASRENLRKSHNRRHILRKNDEKNWKVNSSRALETHWIAEVLLLLSCSSTCCTNVLWVSHEPLDFFKVFNIRNHFAQVLFVSRVSLHLFSPALSGSSRVNKHTA